MNYMRQYDEEYLNCEWNERSKANEVFVENLEAKMKAILGEYYDFLYEFFYNILSDTEHSFKFLIARRCLVLCQLFIWIFSLREKDMEMCGHILSDGALEKEKLDTESKILLVDDILIHGRRIQEVYRRALRKWNKDNIDVSVFMKTKKDVKCLSSELDEKISKIQHAYEWEWKTLSDMIVRVICESNMPYTSFVGAYTVKGKIEIANNESMENTSIIQKDNGCKSEVLFYKNRKSLFEVLSHLDCIRVYSNETNQHITIVPYSFTKALGAESIQNFFEAFSKHLRGLECIKNELIQKRDESYGNLYRLRLYNAVISYLYGKYIENETSNQSLTMEKLEITIKNFDFDTIAKSFGEDIAMEFIQKLPQEAMSIINDDYDELKQYIFNEVSENEEICNLYNDIVVKDKTNKEIKEKYLKYICQQRQLDEIYAREQDEKHAKRLSGISIDYIFKNAGNRLQEYAVTVLNSMDVGCASASFALSEDKKAYASYIASGEQSFRIILEKYAEIIRKMIFLEENMIDVNNYLKILSENFSEKLSSDAIDELKEFYSAHKGEMNESNILSIIENRAYWKIEGIRDFHTKKVTEFII